MIIEDCAAVPTAASALLQPPQTTTKEAAPAIKKGFLNTAKAPLYPTGSSEGAGGATGGSWQRVMDKCKVINTRDMSATEPTPPVKPPAPAPAPSGNTGGKVGGGGGTGGKRPTDKELDALFCQLDDDFAQADRHLRAMVHTAVPSCLPLLPLFLTLTLPPTFSLFLALTSCPWSS